MRKAKAEIYATLIIICIGIYCGVGGIRLGIGSLIKPGSGFAIFWASLVLTLLSFTLLINLLFISTKERISLSKRKEWYKPFISVLSMLIYVALLEKLGYILITVILLFIHFSMQGISSKNWKQIAIASLITTFASYYLFSSLLGLNLPKGYLPI